MTSFGVSPEMIAGGRARHPSSALDRREDPGADTLPVPRTSAPLIIEPDDVELDLCSAPSLARQLHQTNPTRDVVVDFQGVRFCDSSGIQVLVAAWHRQTRGGASLRVSNTSPHVTQVFHMMGLEALLLEER
jgi:anti-anti-sigma factor